MAQITITIPDGIKDRIIDGFAARYGYADIIKNPDGTTEPNTETKPQFVKRMIIQFIRNEVTAYEAHSAAEAARTAAVDEVKKLSIT